MFSVVSAFVVGLVAIVYIAVAGRWGSRFSLVAGLLALAGHACVTFLVLPQLPYAWDIENFHRAALALLAGQPSPGSVSVTAFATPQALLYATFSQSPTVVSVVNGLLAVLIAFPAGYLARTLYPNLDRHGADGVFALVAFSPLPFLYLTVPMRDALSVLLLFVVLALAVSAFRDAPRRALVVPPLWGILYLLRTELALVFVLGVVAAATLAGINGVLRRPVSLGSFVAVGSLVAVVGLVLFRRRFPLEQLQHMLRARAVGSAVYLPRMSYETWIDPLVAAPARAVYFQFAPFPLHVTSAFHVMAVAPLPLLVVLAVAAVRSLVAWETDDVVLALLAVTYLAGVLGYGIVDSNFGTTVRHRIPFVFLLVVFSAPVLQRWTRSLRRWIRQRPGQGRDHGEREREAEELDGRSEARL